MLLNKFVKEALLQVLTRKDISVSMTGNINLYVIVVRDNKKRKIFGYLHKKEGDFIYVNKECVASAQFPSEDMSDVYKALSEKIKQDKKAEQIEKARKEMRDFDIRAIEFLKQYNKTR